MLHFLPYKKHNMRWSVLLLIISLSACKTKGPACLIHDTDILKGAHAKLIASRDAGNRVTALYDEGWDSLKGGAYLFYSNGLLKSYTFYQNRMPVYSETYDEQGHLTHSQGSPMVDRVINELSLDSAYVEVYFFDILKSYQQLNIKINSNVPVNYNLEKDSSYSNIRSVTFGIRTSDLAKINMYSQIKYLDDCTKIEHVLSDSLFLIKDPHIGPAPPVAK
jgi:hypothetical protein